MDSFGIDYNTIFSYVHRHWPWALPYIQFIMYVTPFVLYASGKIADHMPIPGRQFTLFSDIDLYGKLNERWYRMVDKFVQSGNQVIILINFILKSRLYALAYHILCTLGNRVKKTDDVTPTPKIIVTPQPTPKVSHDPDDIPIVSPDNLTPEQIQTRSKFLSDQLTKASVKTLRTVAAQKVVQLDTPKTPDQKDKSDDGQTRIVS